MKGQDVGSVLALFGTSRAKAVRGYRTFIADGIGQGARPELIGRVIGRDGSVGPADSRVLGDTGFVEEIRVQHAVESRVQDRIPVAVIAENAAAVHSVPVRALSAGGRREAVVRARSMTSFLALEEGHSVTEIARYLGLSRNGVVAAARRHVEQPNSSVNEKSAT